MWSVAISDHAVYLLLMDSLVGSEGKSGLITKKVDDMEQGA